MNQYHHWILEKDPDNLLWLGFNRHGSTANTISSEVLDELHQILQEVEKNTDAKGLVIYSKKSKGFIAGADVHEFSNFTQPTQASEFLRTGQMVFAQLEALSIPTVAMIHGFCMGGGLEMSLACRYRIATDDNSTKLGLPEVMLGIIPGWGGNIRLPKLIGSFNALTQVILTGIPVSASRAKTLGIVDDVVPYRQLKRAARYVMKHQPERHKPSWMHQLTDLPWVRNLVAGILRRQVSKRISKQHYPAPFAAIDLWENTIGQDERAYRKEIETVEHLVNDSMTSKNLIRLFSLREKLKNFAKGSQWKAQHVHVIGAGVMGGDIAAYCALKGLSVTLQDQSYQQIAPAIGRAAALFKKKLKKPRLIQATMDRLTPDPEGHGVARADVIIEAVFENLQVKQTIMKTLERYAQKDAIIATNTSSIPLDEINTVMTDPSRLVGIHFFNPVAQMELVEVVFGQATNSEILQKAYAFVDQIGRLPLPVKSSPGFLINRVLMPYLLECMQLLDEGHQASNIDSAAKEFGMMMGPVELADTVGLDVCLAVADNLTQHFGGTIPQRLRDMVKEGKLGRKSGEGFYHYKNGKPIKAKAADSNEDQDIANRLILRMINEAATCLREGVVADSDLLDAGMVFGTGFAPFRGGPIHYANTLGHDNLNALFSNLAGSYGERFKVDKDLFVSTS